MTGLMRWSRINRAARALVEETEAFLAGTYVELCEQHEAPTPVWAWINLLAHGTVDQLRGAVALGSGTGRWRHARGFLAGELVDLADSSHRGLVEFQRDVLQPLELYVISWPEAYRWQPSELVETMLRSLHGNPSSEPR